MNMIDLLLLQIDDARMIGNGVGAASPLSMFLGRMLWLMPNGYRRKQANVTACPPNPSGSMPPEAREKTKSGRERQMRVSFENTRGFPKTARLKRNRWEQESQILWNRKASMT